MTARIRLNSVTLAPNKEFLGVDALARFHRPTNGF
jgi:hypothetical protein